MSLRLRDSQLVKDLQAQRRLFTHRAINKRRPILAQPNAGRFRLERARKGMQKRFRVLRHK